MLPHRRVREGGTECGFGEKGEATSHFEGVPTGGTYQEEVRGFDDSMDKQVRGVSARRTGTPSCSWDAVC